jgi:hypothetical protein
MFAYPCPSCSQRLLAPVERAGQRTVCPKCLAPLTVPHPENKSTDPFGPNPVGLTVVGHTVDTPTPVVGGPEGEPISTLVLDEAAGSHPDLDLEPVAVAESVAPVAVAAAAVMAPPKPAETGTPLPKPAARKVVSRERDGHVLFGPSGPLAVDVVAELSAAISMRMAPPPEPASDRTVVFVGWLLGLVTGLTTWTLGAILSPTWFPYVALVGGAMAVFGLLWRAYLSGRGGNLAAGLATLLPPVCLVQLLRPVGSHGLRPLRFVLTGVALCGLYAVGPKTHAAIEDALGVRLTPNESTTPAPTESAQTLAEQMKDSATRSAARKSLVALGSQAEPAVLPLLTSDSEATVLAACDVLERIGGGASRTALRKLADATAVRAVRMQATEAIDAITKRLSTTK